MKQNLKKLENVVMGFAVCMMVLLMLFAISVEVQAETTIKTIPVNRAQSISTTYIVNEKKQYYFEIPSAGKVNVTFTHPNRSTTNDLWKLTLCNFENEPLMEMCSAGTETNKTSTDVGLAAGQYYIKVDAWHDGTESCTLKVNYSASDNWEKEDNDGFGTANDILLNTQYSGANQFNQEDDYYKFTLTSAGEISLNFKHPVLHDNNPYWYADVYNEQTEHLLQLRIKGAETDINSAELGLEAGVYYLKVDTDFYSDVTYTFTMNYVASSTWESESNDGYGTADVISLNTQYSGANQFSSDDDYYKFILTSAGKVSINFQHPILIDNNVYWKLYIYNEKTEKVLDVAVRGTQYNITTGELGVFCNP